MAAPLLSVRALGCVLASACLASCPPGGSSNYQEILRTAPEEPIDLVHVKQLDAGFLALEIYHAGTSKKESWSSQQGSTSSTGSLLGPRQDFVLSRNWRYLGIRELSPSATGMQTSFTFVTGPAGVQPPTPVPGARQIQLSDDAGQLLYTEHQSEGDGPANVTGFRLDPQNLSSYKQSGSYVTTQQGVAELSESGSLVVQADGGVLQILTAEGDLRGTTGSGIGFALARAGNVVAVREPLSVRFLPLEADGTPIPTQETVLPVPQPALDVEFVEQWAVVHTRSSVHLVEWATGTELLRRDITEGVVASTDLYVRGPDKFLIAIGRLEPQKPQRRAGGVTEWGSAIGHVDLVDRSNQNAFPSHRFRTSRWSFDEPRVRIQGPAQRVVVRCDDVVLVSEQLPKTLFQ